MQKVLQNHGRQDSWTAKGASRAGGAACSREGRAGKSEQRAGGERSAAERAGGAEGFAGKDPPRKRQDAAFQNPHCGNVGQRFKRLEIGKT